MLTIKYDYTIRTVDNRKYSYENIYNDLDSVYKNIMSNDCVEVTKWDKDKKVLIDTRHIVSIEKW